MPYRWRQALVADVNADRITAKDVLLMVLFATECALLFYGFYWAI